MKFQNWWEKTLFEKKPQFCAPLKDAVSCELLVLGGGIAGLHAALTLVEHGKDVVLPGEVCVVHVVVLATAAPAPAPPMLFIAGTGTTTVVPPAG